MCPASPRLTAQQGSLRAPNCTAQRCAQPATTNVGVLIAAVALSIAPADYHGSVAKGSFGLGNVATGESRYCYPGSA